MPRVSVCFLPLVTALFLGCSSSQPEADVTYEVITIEQQAEESVASMPTKFVVPFENATASWARARVFFSKYVVQPPSFDQLSSGGARISNTGTEKDTFLYEVEKFPSKDGYKYAVYCKPTSKPALKADALQSKQEAKQNAKNLARFIQDGQLEVSLLHR